jgi:cell division protein FtsQ
VSLTRGIATAGVGAPGDKRFRRPDVRPAGRRRLASWCWRLARVCVAVAVIAGSGYGLAHVLLSSRMFVIGRVLVHGNTRLSTAEVEALVQGLRGQQILRADLDIYRQHLMESPWVASAAMRRVLPGTIDVRITERTPMAIARIAERLYLVDASGVIVDEFGPEYREFDLPVVDGLVPAGTTTSVDESRAALTREFLGALQADAALRQRVSQIDVSDSHDVVVLLDGDKTIVHLGDAKFLARLRTYQDLAPALQSRLKDIDYVDMRFDERVYVKSKGQIALATPDTHSH